MSAEYAVALHGEPFDLEDLREVFTAGPTQVVEIDVPPGQRITALLAREFDGLPSGVQAQEMARRLIGQMNGILFASSADRSPIRMGAIHARSNGGAWGSGATYMSCNAGIGRVRARGAAGMLVIDGVPVPAVKETPRQIAWLALASGPADPNPAADVLRALSGQPDWFDLWKAEEIIHPDRQSLPNSPRDDIEWFRRTATRYRHSPSHKRGREAQKWFKASGKPEMELEAARRLLAALSAQWLDWKAGQKK